MTWAVVNFIEPIFDQLRSAVSVAPTTGTATGGLMALRTESPGVPGWGLTRRQRSIVEVIEDSVRRRGYAPTVREIGDAVGLASPSSVAYQLSPLEEMGYLSRGPGRPRTPVVRPIPDPELGPGDGDLAGHRIARVPLVGRIAAGGPIFADQSIEDVILLPRQLVGDGDLILLRVVGDSMIDAAITDGDWVAVRRESDVENGDIVAATFESDTSADQEATIKTYK